MLYMCQGLDPKKKLPNTQQHSDSKSHEGKSWKMLTELNGLDTEADMLSGITRKRSLRSSSYWFTEFCNSQCLSQFAVPFIVLRAETSIAESCKKRTEVDEHFWKMESKGKVVRKKCVTTGTERR